MGKVANISMRRTPTRTELGYGVLHQRRRAREAKRVAAGEAFCTAPTCKHPRDRWIAPDEPWDLGHHPFDRSRYLGPMHRACNRDTRLERSARRSARRQPRAMRAPAGAWL
jgi:hypothetical protein